MVIFNSFLPIYSALFLSTCTIIAVYIIIRKFRKNTPRATPLAIISSSDINFNPVVQEQTGDSDAPSVMNGNSGSDSEVAEWPSKTVRGQLLSRAAGYEMVHLDLSAHQLDVSTSPQYLKDDGLDVSGV
jgi:hypothetical protein